MIRRRLWISLVGIVLVAAALLGINLGLGNEPALGLDLRGGVSVVIAPTDDASDDELRAIRDVVHDHLRDRGILEPEVRVEGDRVVADIPGVADQGEAMRAVGVAGIVAFRPVVSPCAEPAPPTTDSSVPSGSGPDSDVPDGSVPDASAPATSTADTGAPATTSATTDGPAGLRRPAAADPTDPTSADTTADSAPASTPSDGPVPDDSVPDSSVPDSTVPETTTEPPLGPIGPGDFGTPPASPFTPLPPIDADSTVTLRDANGLECTVGPVQRDPDGNIPTDSLFARGSANVTSTQGFWHVEADLSDTGSSVYNAIAAACMSGSESCPTGQIALVVDGVVESSQVVQSTQAGLGGDVTIAGVAGEDRAETLAELLDRGAFPVDVRVADARTVSPTLGRGVANALIVAVVVGAVLVLGILGYLYRRLVAVVLAGAVVWAVLAYSVSAFVAEATNHAISLAGLAGILVAIAIMVDSHVIYFERLKDEARHGRSLRNSVVRSFKASWRTVLAANLTAVIGAAAFVVLSAGSIRTFGLFLGITTLAGAAVFYFFARPAIALLATNGWLERGDTFGLEDGTR